MKKERAHITVLTVILNYLNHQQNMKADQDGHLFLNLFQMYLKLKPITISVMLGQSIIVKNVGDIMDTYLMMVHNLLAKDTVTTVFVWYLSQKTSKKGLHKI